ncbi:calmodulin binding protein PICBP [Andrographis paniculata]|uniref:calmodulin binding protein PICBP n=1 Tax=Andrographis paniculata TaxID=175694 RepID=UPI0021E70439|nr:calmodulin binding protein PICBP [Andrographis paniculata]
MVQRTKAVARDHDARTKPAPADLKKKKKKKTTTVSINPSEMEAVVRQRNPIKENQPGEPPPPPPLEVVADAATPRKQSPVRSPAAKTPNYMRSTTSSDARKEQSRVSSKSPSSDCLDSRRKGLKSSRLKTLASGNKATAAMKTTRTLTKNSSFKLTRASVIRKCSPVALCENFDAQKATCSSTLKDCKFPAYLSLNPGGTESVGTSAVKVCPYTYCSLNGHRHAPVPPLKCFLSARRRMVKAQRSIKLGCLSPRRGKPVEVTVQDHVESPRINPQSEDFFVEIFCKTMGDAAEFEHTASIDESNKIAAEEQPVEMLLDAQPIDESLDENGDAGFTDISDQNEDQSLEDGKLETYDKDYSTSDTDGDTSYSSILYIDHGDQECSLEAEMETNFEDEGSFDELMVDKVSPGLSNYLLNSAYDHVIADPANHDKGKPDTAAEEISFDDQESVQSLEMQSYGDGADEASVQVASEEEHPRVPVPTSDPKCVDSASAEFDAEDGAFPQNRAKSNKPIEESNDQRDFNPRPPNFLPLDPDPEAEKIDLRHQELDDKKNTEEWMVDYALRQVVAKLGPARKRKVALLVEAFERVAPITKWEFHMSHSPAFGLPSPVQACM